MDRGCQLVGAVAVEQPQQVGDHRPEAVSALDGIDEHAFDRGNRVDEAVLAAVDAGLALSLDQGVDMPGVFDLGALVEAAAVGRDNLVAVDDAQPAAARGDGEGSPDELVRHAVVVRVVANVGRFPDFDGLDVLDRERRVGERAQMRPLGLERLSDRSALVAGAGAAGGDGLAPVPGLGVEVVEVAPFARRPEVVAHISYAPLHPALLVASADPRRLEPGAVVVQHLHGGRVELDGLAAAPRNRAL